MIDFKTYQRELALSLIKIYIKSLLIKEYISIFPTIAKLKFDFNFLRKKWQIEIEKNNSFIEEIKNVLNINTSEFNKITIEAIDEILESLTQIYSSQLSIVKDFPLSLPVFDTEYASSVDEGFINESKYQTENIYIERYIRVSANPQPGTFLAGRTFRDVVSVPSFFQLLNIDNNSDEDFFQIVSNIKMGVRCVYLPNVLDSDKPQLYNNLKNDLYVLSDKINLIRGKFENNLNFNYFFPLKIAEIEFSLYDLLPKSKQSYLDFITLNQLQIFTSLIKQFWTNDNFTKLFYYHIPVPSFEILIPSEQLIVKDLIKKVYDSNLPYNNLDNILIKLIRDIVYIEDPTRN